MRTSLLAGAIALTLSTFAGAADAAISVLYRNDGLTGTDYMGMALNDAAYSVTSITGDLSGYDLSSYDLVVYANQSNYTPSNDLGVLDSHVTNGGKLIYTNWTADHPALGGTDLGFNNADQLNVGSLFGSGVYSMSNPGWGIYSRSLSATTGTVAGAYSDGTAAIIVGNGGRTIWNGFLTDSTAATDLYKSQLSYVTGGVSAVPEPGTWALMITGFGLAGSALRRRRTLALAA